MPLGISDRNNSMHISNLQLKIRYHDPLNKHPADNYFTICLKKVLLARRFNAIVNCGTPYKQSEMNALRYRLSTFASCI